MATMNDPILDLHLISKYESKQPFKSVLLASGKWSKNLTRLKHA